MINYTEIDFNLKLFGFQETGKCNDNGLIKYWAIYKKYGIKFILLIYEFIAPDGFSNIGFLSFHIDKKSIISFEYSNKKDIIPKIKTILYKIDFVIKEIEENYKC